MNFERVELVRDGEVIFSKPSISQNGHYAAEFEISLDVSNPCWLALRTPPPSTSIDPELSDPTPLNEYGQELFSHTSASFVDLGGRRIFSQDVGQELLQEMETSQLFSWNE